MTAIFYDKGKTPMKTVHFGATGFIVYIIAPHDGERRHRYNKTHQERIWTIICLVVRYQDICYGNLTIKHCY